MKTKHLLGQLYPMKVSSRVLESDVEIEYEPASSYRDDDKSEEFDWEHINIIVEGKCVATIEGADDFFSAVDRLKKFIEKKI